MSADGWRAAVDQQADWLALCREKLAAAEAQRDTYAEALREVVNQFNLWSEDANDGTYAYWKSDGLMVACIAARVALAAVPPAEAKP